jgi:hypothetical protein
MVPLWRQLGVGGVKGGYLAVDVDCQLRVPLELLTRAPTYALSMWIRHLPDDWVLRGVS